MIQLSYHIRDFEYERLREILSEVSSTQEYRGAAQVLAVVFDQCADAEKSRKKAAMIRSVLPKAEVVGTTHIDSFESAVTEQENTLVTFMLFEAPAFSVHRLPLKGLTAAGAGQKLGGELALLNGLKGVWFFAAGILVNIDEVLTETEKCIGDVPIFGSTAARIALSENVGTGFLFDGNTCTDNALAAVCFTGEDLHIEVSYDHGWSPVGRTMRITGCDGDFRVTSIDNAPAADIYHKYLGLDRDAIIIPNICEFPLIIEQDGLNIGRTPFACDREGALGFGAPMVNGSLIRFSYGSQSILLSETYDDSVAFGRFSPQAMILVVCMNRQIFLKEEEEKEIGYYRRICPTLAYTHGNSEIYRFRGRGGETNGALVAVGIREGAQDRSILQCTVPPYDRKKKPNAIIPLERRITAFMHAVTEDLEDMTRRANAASEAKSAFLANMSHDIRTPINAVLGMNEMVLRECSDENILTYSENIRTAGNTLLGLINDILDFSKIEAGKLDIIPVDYDLSSVLNDLVNMVQTRAEAKGLKLVPVIDESTPKLLRGDEIRIKQIVTNILTNAVKYTEKGSVTFAVNYEKTGENTILLKVSVTDTGIGIKQEDIPKLFSKFDRIEEKRNRNVEGTGLGMSITQRLLSMMNSSLEVKSEYGKGSEFSFAISQPVVKWEPVGDYSEAFRRSAANRKKYKESFTAPDAEILVVDDTPMNLEVFRALLKKTLVRIDTAESGAQCIALSAKKKYDVIFLDHMMPDKDGIETLKEMRELTDSPNADTPVICLTANAISGARETYLNAGFTDYLSKPVEPERLEETLAGYIPEHKLKAAGEGVSEAQAADSAIPDYVRSSAEIDTAQGIKHCGNEESYLQALTTYAGSVNALAEETEGYLLSGDIRNFTVKVHALKSTSRVIGAMKLGDLAEKLEAAGHTNNTAFIADRTDELLERCRALGELLSPLTESGSLPLISAEQLDEAYTLIREFLSVADYESAIQIISELGDYSFPENEKTRCEALIKAAGQFDYDKMNEIMK